MSNERNIILIGFMGSGKTTVGRLLSKAVGFRFIDTDTEIEQAGGMSIPHIFTYGESYFRDLEADVVRGLRSARKAVIATGGGVIKREDNIAALRSSGVVFYLRWPVEELYGHVKDGTNRPLLNVSNPMEEMKVLLFEREPLYVSAAHIIIECAGKRAETITKEIEAHIEEHSGHSRG
ncbi:MAG: shikimate kinase [Clostridiales bacterium]|jgi:shikimate kinase|nr:shikimate kinase [Clostridiales bacterium]